jgi:hypothetical protein
MKLFAINETEWIAALTEDDALEHEGLERNEVKSIEEIPESEWDAEIFVCLSEEFEDKNEPKVIKKTVRELIQPAIESGIATKILTEMD